MILEKKLIQYHLNDVIFYFDNPSKTDEWNKYIKKVFKKYSADSKENMILSYENLQYLIQNYFQPVKIHPVNKMKCKSTRDISRLNVKLKIITGTYILQDIRAKFSKNQVETSPLRTKDIEN